MSQLRPSHQYTAVSYAWGDSDDAIKIPIDCDGRIAWLTPNLHSALLRLRRADKSMFVWADALCIDQAPTSQGLTEKEQQVQTMDLVFSRAEQVMIDLGNDSAFDVLALLDRFYNIPSEIWAEACSIARTADFKSFFGYLAQFELPGVEEAFWRAFADFMQRPWFRRVWVIQEYALAKKATFLIGEDMRPGSYLPEGFLRALQYMVWLYHYDRRRGPGEGPPSDDFARCVWDFDEPHVSTLLIREARESRPDGLPLHTLLWRTRRFLAKDNRDKVYAILGLVQGGKLENRIQVKYTNESVVDLGTRVARYLIEAGSGPYVLYNCLALESPACSWALVLTAPKLDVFSDLYRPSGYVENQVYNACGDTKFAFRWGRNSTLIVKGCIIDKILSAGPALPHVHTITHEKLAGCSPWLGETWDWMMDAQKLQEVPAGEFNLQGWQTVTADLIIPPTREGEGYVRASTQEITPLCLEALDNASRHASAKRRNVEHEFVPTMAINQQFLAYLNFLSESFRYSFGRRLALTQNHHLTCCVPRETSDGPDGDYICIILGCPMPFVVRCVEDHYRVVGSCYVHGLMDGQAMAADFWKEEDIEIR